VARVALTGDAHRHAAGEAPASGIIDLPTLVDRMSVAPARVFGLPGGTLRPGSVADITIFDPSREWVVDPSRFRTKGRNTPYTGRTLTGRATCTIVGGTIVYESDG
jgi:dihydroorotase